MDHRRRREPAPSPTDPLGSYTGTPANDEDKRPTQDADDL